ILTSPQGLTCKCKIQDNARSISGGPQVLDVRFMSSDETRVGPLFDLPFANTAASTGNYRVHAGVCQIFVKLLGQTHGWTSGGAGDTATNYDFAGGIPYVPADIDVACTVPGAAAITELWWSAGAWSGQYPSLRDSRYCLGNYSVCRNGS